MKKVLVFALSLLTVLLCFVSCDRTETVNELFSGETLEVLYQDGKFVVKGAFEYNGEETGKYTVSCLNVKDDADGIEIKKEFNLVNGNNEFEFFVPVSAKNQTLTASVFVGEKEIVNKVEKTVKSLRLLSVGNSFSVDAQQHLYGIAKDMGYDNVVLGNLYIGGCSLQGHYSTYINERASYIYYKNTSGEWTEKPDTTFLEGLKDERWDYITLQQSSGFSGDSASYQPHLENLVSYIKLNRTNPNAQLLWHMTWAYSGDSTHQDFVRYDNDQMKMYDGIVNAVKENVLGNSDISFVIPAGTAIQNARATSLGDTLCRDGFHLDLNYGRYLAGLTWIHKISGLPIGNVTFIPDGAFDEATLEILKECAVNAVANPFEVTE